jgi:hypothetical protein
VWQATFLINQLDLRSGHHLIEFLMVEWGLNFEVFETAGWFLFPATGEKRKVLFSCFKVLKILQDFSSHQIFGRMHEVLNIGKKITNCTI